MPRPRHTELPELYEPELDDKELAKLVEEQSSKPVTYRRVAVRVHGQPYLRLRRESLYLSAAACQIVGVAPGSLARCDVYVGDDGSLLLRPAPDGAYRISRRRGGGAYLGGTGLSRELQAKGYKLHHPYVLTHDAGALKVLAKPRKEVARDGRDRAGSPAGGGSA